MTYFTPGFNEGALWALQMFESSGHLPFLQEIIWICWIYKLPSYLLLIWYSIDVNGFVVCRRGCSQPHSPSQLTCASFCRIIFSRALRSVSGIIASSQTSCSKYCTQPFPNIPVPIPFGYATGVGDQEACANVQGCTKYLLIKLVSLMMKCWKYGIIGVQMSVFVQHAFSCFALCRCRNSILPQHHAAFLFPIWGYGASK